MDPTSLGSVGFCVVQIRQQFQCRPLLLKLEWLVFTHERVVDAFSIDHHRPGSTERVEDRLVWSPARKPQQPGCQVFLQWRFKAFPSPTPFEERFAGPVQVQRGPVSVKVGKDASVGSVGIDGGTLSAVLAMAIDHAVLDTLHREVQTLQGRSGGRHINSKGRNRVVPLLPRRV